MKKLHLVTGLTVALLAGSVLAAEKVESGPQVGKKIPGAFHPLNVTGAKAGEKNCLVCQNGLNPVAMIFARDTSDSLTKLLKKVDEVTAKNKGCEMGSFVVFLGEKEGMQKKLETLAKDNNLKNIILAIDENRAGPKDYNVSKDADVTVVLYVESTVKANYAFKKGELKDKDIEAIVADVAKITPSK
jgi:hypothetical protein